MNWIDRYFEELRRNETTLGVDICMIHQDDAQVIREAADCICDLLGAEDITIANRLRPIADRLDQRIDYVQFVTDALKVVPNPVCEPEVVVEHKLCAPTCLKHVEKPPTAPLS